MKPLLLSSLLGAVLFNALVATAAPLGTAFTYQGRLTDGGSPATGLYDLQFKLYDAATAGSGQGGLLTTNAVPVSNGLFGVTLDFGAGVFTGEARWLDIAVKTNGAGVFTTLSPRQALTAAPYALYTLSAGNATLLNGQSSTAYAPAIGSPAYVAKAGDTMTGTLNLPANGLVAGGSQLVLADGGVGIGTVSPQTQWDVTSSGDARIQSATLSADGAGVLNLAAPGGRAELFFGGTNYPSWGGPLSLNLVNVAEGPLTFGHFFNGSGFERMRITSAGNMGIGTASPAAALHLAVPGSSSRIEALNVDVASFATDTNAAASHFLRIRDVGAGDVKFIVRGTGNVGIGTADPAAALHVAGAVAIGNTTDPAPPAGTIRWTGTDFEGYNGTNWLSLTGRGTTPTNGVSPYPNMVWIAPGTFVMGSPNTEVDRQPSEGPQTTVTLTRGFYMSKYQVTQGEYSSLMNTNPSYFTGDLNRPVEGVSWNDAVSYCVSLTQREQDAGRIPASYQYRLPTEAEWEYACRAGTTTRFSYGDDPGYGLLGNYAWYSANSGSTTHLVGQKLHNPWGLYDMHGNVWEWCQDWYPDDPPFYPGGSVTDPQGLGAATHHVFRGGNCHSLASDCRSASRHNCNVI